MTRDEIVNTLRRIGERGTSVIHCDVCPFYEGEPDEWCFCDENAVCAAAADLIENQQRHIEALMKANDSLKDAVVRKEEGLVKRRAGDVAPMVRCTDCEHSYEDIGGRTCAYGPYVDYLVEDDFFCKNGERRADDADQR